MRQERYDEEIKLDAGGEILGVENEYKKPTTFTRDNELEIDHPIVEIHIFTSRKDMPGIRFIDYSSYTKDPFKDRTMGVYSAEEKSIKV